ncbi:MAG: DEAD/DEAH box helicase [Chloroflexi bacterium]|nr:MAG: DEAD/DEAH box helicase [Chloroflexota bacterium]
MHFSEFELNPALQKAVGIMGYQNATPIQSQAIPHGLDGRDVIGCAQTGTGKTAAFLLPALQRLLQDPTPSRHPRLVVLAPTRELVIQVADHARQLARHTSLRIAAIYGGAKIGPQISKLQRGVDVIIATPGRLLDHMRRKNIDFRHLQVLILDEADRMLDMGFIPDIKYIVSRMPQQRQTMLFSATMSSSVLNLTRQFQQNPVKVEVSLARPPEAIRQALYPVPKHLKTKLLIALLKQLDVTSMLVFTATRQQADIVTRQLSKAGIAVGCIHGDFRQRERIAALEGFRSGKYQVLVATNIAARGLDVEGISHVINYDVPQHAEDYIHRIGRTARAEADGDAITLVTPDDEGLIYRIEYLLGRKLERKTLPGFNYDVPTPSWAKPSPKALSRQQAHRTLGDRWRSMGGGNRRRGRRR